MAIFAEDGVVRGGGVRGLVMVRPRSFAVVMGVGTMQIDRGIVAGVQSDRKRQCFESRRTVFDRIRGLNGIEGFHRTAGRWCARFSWLHP